LASSHEVGKRLTTERFIGLCDSFTRHGMDKRLVQRGKKKPFGRVRNSRRSKSRRRPSACATVALAEATGRPLQQPLRFAGPVADAGAARAENAERLGLQRFADERYRGPLARNRRESYKKRDVVLA
jgi:hypothetical protein